MLHKVKNRKQEGFTIIEVLIVLAIAALILVVVLIAVPNLQRSQRNSARKDEASRILTAANTVIANNNGTQLTGVVGDATSVRNESGTLRQLVQTDGTALTDTAGGTASTMTANQFRVAAPTSAGTVTYSTANSEAVLVLQGASCGAAGAYTLAPRQLAVFYSSETTGGGRTPLCISS